MPNRPPKPRRPWAILPLPPVPPIEEALAGVPVRLRSLRLHLGLTAREMGARVGVGARSWRRRERTPPSPNRGILFEVRLRGKFDVSIDWLLFGTAAGMPRNDHRPLRPDGEPLFLVH